jgi:hypothetical protein
MAFRFQQPGNTTLLGEWSQRRIGLDGDADLIITTDE